MCPISYSFVFSLPLISHTFESFLSPCVYSSLIPLSLSASYSSYVPISLIPLTSTLSLIFILFITHLDKHSYAINILVPPLKIQDLILPPFNYVLLSPYTYMWAKLGHFLFIFVLFTMQWKIDCKMAKSANGAIRIQTLGWRMEGTDESTGLLRPPVFTF